MFYIITLTIVIGAYKISKGLDKPEQISKY